MITETGRHPSKAKWKYWRWWLGLIIQGWGITMYPPIIKWPLILVWVRHRQEGEKRPWFYGLAWTDWSRDSQILIYTPFNFIVAWIKWFWEYVRYTGIPDESWIQKERLNAYVSGMNYGKKLQLRITKFHLIDEIAKDELRNMLRESGMKEEVINNIIKE